MNDVVIGKGAVGNAATRIIEKINPRAGVTIISDENYPFFSLLVFYT